jgi:hypothetical protein
MRGFSLKTFCFVNTECRDESSVRNMDTSKSSTCYNVNAGNDEDHRYWQHTFDHDILDTFFLRLPCAAFSPFILFSQFGQYEWSYSFDYAWKRWVVAFQQPCLGICWTIQINADFKDRVLCDAQVSSEWGHVSIM